MAFELPRSDLLRIVTTPRSSAIRTWDHNPTVPWRPCIFSFYVLAFSCLVRSGSFACGASALRLVASSVCKVCGKPSASSSLELAHSTGSRISKQITVSRSECISGKVKKTRQDYTGNVEYLDFNPPLRYSWSLRLLHTWIRHWGLCAIFGAYKQGAWDEERKARLQVDYRKMPE